MHRTSIIVVIILSAFLNFSCANLKSSLTKSDSYSSGDIDKQHGYANSSLKKDSLDLVKKGFIAPAGNVERKLPESTMAKSSADFNQNLVNQYAEMDKLGDLVLYELDVTEKRKESLLELFRSASAIERESITNELNKLDKNQLTLYGAYVKVYKNGKSNWPAVRKSVEDTLLMVRGVGNK